MTAHFRKVASHVRGAERTQQSSHPRLTVLMLTQHNWEIVVNTGQEPKYTEGKCMKGIWESAREGNERERERKKREKRERKREMGERNERETKEKDKEKERGPSGSGIVKKER